MIITPKADNLSPCYAEDMKLLTEKKKKKTHNLKVKNYVLFGALLRT